MEVLTEDEASGLITKWSDKQQVFEDDYVATPACVHVVVKSQVKRLSLWTMELEAPTPRSPTTTTTTTTTAATKSKHKKRR